MADACAGKRRSYRKRFMYRNVQKSIIAGNQADIPDMEEIQQALSDLADCPGTLCIHDSVRVICACGKMTERDSFWNS